MVFLPLARRRAHDGADQISSSITNDLFGNLTDLSRWPIEGNHRRIREKAESLTLVEKPIGVVGGSPPHERLP